MVCSDYGRFADDYRCLRNDYGHDGDNYARHGLIRDVRHAIAHTTETITHVTG